MKKGQCIGRGIKNCPGNEGKGWFNHTQGYFEIYYQ